MSPGGKAAATWRILLLALLWATVLAKDAPEVKVTKLEHPPLNLNYFEDSDVIVYQDTRESNVYRSEDAGVKWKRVDDVPDGKSMELIMHPFDHERAYIITSARTHYKTSNRGKSWDKFEIKSAPSKFQSEVMIFHAGDPDRIIFNAMDCKGIYCGEKSLYTTNNFDKTQDLRVNTEGCWWAKSSLEFTTGDAEKDKSRILCIVRDSISFFPESQRLTISDAYFAVSGEHIQEFEPNLNGNKGVTGELNLAVVKSHLLIATSSPTSDEMALYVTDNTLQWHRAIFPTDDDHDHSHRINQGAYTVLQSTNYSIQIDVMTSRPSQPMGVLFTSNSNGTYYTENIPYTNRNRKGLVDFEKISGIQGIFLVNTVENGRDVAAGKSKDKTIVTHITLDDGRTFDEIKADGERLHLHSVTEMDNVGMVYSSPAPGLVMGNGNTGKSLGKFADANLYVSDDAGLTWKEALKGPHKYEFGDSGSVLVAIKDSTKDDINEFSYSLDHGQNWKSVPLPDDLSMKPDLLTTTQDSTSLKFLLLGETDRTYHMIAIDFDGLHERTCKDKDMEDWHARTDKDGKPTCIMGHKQTYRRRKKSADCFIKKEFKDPVPETEDCECTDADFECDYNFQRDDDNNCKKVGPIPSPEDVCKDNPEGKFQGSSGWRLIPGNTCKRTDGKQKDDKTERKCSEGEPGNGKPSNPPATGEITVKQHVFDDFKLKGFEKVYLEQGDIGTSSNETVIVRSAGDPHGGKHEVGMDLWQTDDHGKTWQPILKGEKIHGIFPHTSFTDVVFFTTNGKEVFYTADRGHYFHSFKAPTKAKAGSIPLQFHPDKKDWLIWTGEVCDEIGGHESCFLESSVSQDRGDDWKTLKRFVNKCEFTGNKAYNFRSDKQVVCHVRKEEKPDANYTLASSNDFFNEDNFVYDGQVVDFATWSEFIIFSSEDEQSGAKHAVVSLDGKQFEDARYPHKFHEGHDDHFTVLESNTHALNIFVRSDAGSDRNFGSIIKSNSNGTTFVLSAANVNGDTTGYVDFEKVAGLEGVALINVVTNTGKDEKTKTLQTKISHNDGAEWAYLPPPSKDVDGKSYGCSSSKGDESCALHLHHYTERDDKGETFAANTAVGLLFGIGHVGSKLGNIKEADTFLSTDGGISWDNVKKGHWTWQYGDQGSIIVLVQRATRQNQVKTKMVSYSVDEGKTWKEYEFSDADVTVLDITTLKSGASRNFLLWCRDGDKMMTFNLDFTGLTDKPCQFNEDSPTESDYVLWSPQHPLQDDDCLFGHVAKYLRKKTDRKCYNEQSLKRLYKYTNCACSRRDYEWYVSRWAPFCSSQEVSFY